MSIEPISVSAWATAALMESRIGHVQLDHMGVAALAFDLRAQLLELFDTAAGQHHACAGTRQGSANCAPRPLDAPVTKATRPDRSML
jgi:hypothetical protein